MLVKKSDFPGLLEFAGWVALLSRDLALQRVVKIF